MDLLQFELPDDDGTVTIQCDAPGVPMPRTMLAALDRPLHQLILWHACGGPPMQFIRRSERKTVLHCPRCSSATTAHSFENFGKLLLWIFQRRLVCQFSLELTHAEFNR
jgi:hypothetical protein